MSDILNGFNMTNMFSDTTDILSALSPYLALIAGLLLAFFIIKIVINFFKKNEKDYNDIDYIDDYDDDYYF